MGFPITRTGIRHGVTTESEQFPYDNGYFLQDTPGILDATDYSQIIWRAVEESEIVVFTVTEELYRQEVEFLEQISQRQDRWNTLSKSGRKRKLVLFVNQQDVKEATLLPEEIEELQDTIRRQVANWVSTDDIVYGASSPLANRVRHPAKIADLQRLIVAHIQSDAVN